MNCFLYARVSTERQAERQLSIPAQLQAMRRYANDRHWVILGEFVDSAASGRTADRPALRNLLENCRATQPSKVDVVLVHRIDRLTRSLADHIAIKKLLHDAQVILASVVEHIDQTISGELVEHIMASLAQFYSANLSEEVKKGLRQKVLRGGWPHRPPWGYEVSVNVPGEVTIDRTAGPRVRLAFEMAARGFRTWNWLRDELARVGLRTQMGRPLPINTLNNLLRNPFFKGQVRWKGELYNGTHKALVSPVLFDKVQQILAQRRPRRAHEKHRFLLRGLVTCAQCGRRMTAEVHGQFRYYRCLGASAAVNSCRARYCNEQRAHRDLEQLYRGLKLPAIQRRELQVLGRGTPIRLSTDLWEAHTQLSFELQKHLLTIVCSSLSLSSSGIEEVVLKRPFLALRAPHRSRHLG